MRMNVGNGDGVTSASISPETSSTTTSPTATDDHRPALLGERLSAGPVAGRDHRPPELHAHRPGQEDRGQLQQPVRREQAEHDVALPCVEHQAGDEAEVGGVLKEYVRDGNAEQ